MKFSAIFVILIIFVSFSTQIDLNTRIDNCGRFSRDSAERLKSIGRTKNILKRARRLIDFGKAARDAVHHCGGLNSE